MSRLRSALERRGSINDLADAIAASRRHIGAGGVVSPDQALRLGAVWSCVDLICRLAALPVHQYQRTGQARVEVQASPLLASPASDVSPIGWRRQVLMSWVTRGNVFGLVAGRDRMLYPTQVEILDPARVTARRRGGNTGPIEWLVDRQPMGDDLIHWPAFTVPGSPIGLSPLEYAASMVGLGLSARQFGAQWFEDGAHPSSVLTIDEPVDAVEARTVKDRFMASVRGREPVVLGRGFKYEAIQVSPEESQFLETIKANKADIAGFFLVPPEMIGGESGNSMTYANIEQRGLGYLTWNAGWWISLLEEFMSSMTPAGQYVKVNTGALVKVDAKSQAQIHDIRIRGGWGKPDEARAHEDREPLPDSSGQLTLWPPGANSVQATEGGTP